MELLTKEVVEREMTCKRIEESKKKLSEQMKTALEREGQRERELDRLREEMARVRQERDMCTERARQSESESESERERERHRLALLVRESDAERASLLTERSALLEDRVRAERDRQRERDVWAIERETLMREIDTHMRSAGDKTAFLHISSSCNLYRTLLMHNA